MSLIKKQNRRLVDKIVSARRVGDLPTSTRPEVCFLGRSNVGKSSLINAIAGRRVRLAYTSKRPGRTQQINIFPLFNQLVLADLPGYGYAAAPIAVRGSWQQLIVDYIKQRRPLVLACLLLDSRRELSALDQDCLELLYAKQIGTVVVLTKADKLSDRQLKQKVESVTDSLEIFANIRAKPVVTSCRKRSGIQALSRLIIQQCDELGR